MGERDKFIKSLVDQGFSREEIHAKLKEYDKAEKAKSIPSDDTTDVSEQGETSEAFKIEAGSTEFDKSNALYEENRKNYINGTGKYENVGGTKESRERYVDLLVPAPEISQYKKGTFIEHVPGADTTFTPSGKHSGGGTFGKKDTGKTISYQQETDFFNDFEKHVNKNLDAKFKVKRDKDGNVIDVKDKNKKDVIDYQNNLYGDNSDASDDELYKSIYDTIQNDFVSKDPIIKRKSETFNATLEPQVEKIQQQLLDKYKPLFGTSPKGNEKLYNALQKEFKDKVGELQKDFYADPEVQARLQKYQGVANGYFDKLNRKIKRNRSDLFKFYDKTGYLGDLIEGIDIGLTGMMQGYRGIGLQEEEKDLTNAQKRLNTLNQQLKANPDRGDEERKYITGVESFQVTPGPGGFHTRVKTKKGTLNELIKQEEENVKKHTDIYEKRLDRYMKKQDKQALFNTYSITQGEVGLDDILGTIGSVAPYMGVALIPYVGVPLMAAQSYGSSRQGILAKQMSKALGKDESALTAQDYIDFAKGNKEQIDEWLVGAGAVVMAGLERIGATRVAGKTIKALGLGKSASSNVYGSLLKGHLNKFAQGLGGRAKDVSLSSFFEGSTEVSQEFIVGVMDYFSDETINDKSAKNAFINNEYIDSAQVFEAGAAGALVGGLFPGLGGIVKQSVVEMRTAARMFSSKFDMKNNPARAEEYFNGVKKELDRKLKNNEIDQETYDRETDYMQGLYGKSLKIKGHLDADVKHDILNLMYKRDQKQADLNDENTDESEHAKLKKDIEKINSEIQNKQGVSFVEKGVQELKDLGFTEDLEIDGSLTQKELEKKFGKENVSDSEGFFDPVTNKMYVNSELANSKGNITTAQHEFLHPITKALIKAGKIKKETITEMVSKYDKDGYVQGRLDGDKKTYTEEYLNQNPDEYLAMFGEGVAEGKINIEENFSGVKNFFRKAFKMAMPKSDIDFDTVDGLKNFMVEYSKSDREGKLTKAFTGSLEGVKQIRDEEGGVVKSSNIAGQLDKFNGDANRMVNSTLMNTKDGRMVDMDKVPLHQSEFGEEIGGIVEALTKKLFDPIAIDATRVIDDDRMVARNKFKDDLVTKAATLMSSEYKTEKLGGLTVDQWLTQMLYQRGNTSATDLGVEEHIAKRLDHTTDTGGTVDQEGTKKDKEFINLRGDVFEIQKDSKPYKRIVAKVKDIITRKYLTKEKSVKGKKTKVKVKLDFANPNLRKDLHNLFQKEIRKILIEEGVIPKKLVDYQAWLRKKQPGIWGKLSQDVINVRFDDLIKKVIKRMGRPGSKVSLNVKDINAGNALFIKNNIDSDAWVEYFTPRGRKESLGQALSIELADDAVNMVMGDPEVIRTREDGGLNIGVAKGETAVQTMARTVQRPVGLVFSKTAAAKSIGTEAEQGDYKKIINIFKSKDFKDDIRKYAQHTTEDERGTPAIKQVFRKHLEKAGFETIKPKELTKIINEYNKETAFSINNQIEYRRLEKNIDDYVSNYLVNITEDPSSREIVSVLAEVDGKFDKSSVEDINTGRDGAKTFADAVVDGYILDKNGNKIPLKSKKENLGIILSGTWEQEGIGAFTTRGKKGKKETPNSIKVEEKELIPNLKKGKPKQARASFFINVADIVKNIPKFGKAKKDGFNKLLSDLGKKDIYTDPSSKLNKQWEKEPGNFEKIKPFFKELNTEGKKVKKILEETIEDLRTLKKHGYLSNEQVRIKIESLFSDTHGLGRLAAVPTYFPTKPISEIVKQLGLTPEIVKKYIPSSKTGIDPWVLEHMIVANNISARAYQYVTKGDAKSKASLDKELANYKTAIIPQVLDQMLKAGGLQSNMGIKHEAGVDPLISRYKELLEYIELYDVDTDKSIGKNSIVHSKSIKQDKLLDKAMEMSQRENAPKKGITIMDFDGTVANTKSMVTYEIPKYVRSGAHLYDVFMGKIPKKGKLTPEQFAEQSAMLEKRGAIFDFGEFNQVKKGQKGPLFDVIKKRVEKFGNKDVHILTARPQQAAPAIKKFLERNGVDIPIENIHGLENGTSQAKADFMIARAAEGYNDFYFADDILANVDAVKNVLDIVDVKSDVQQAKIVYSKKSNSDRFNEIIEESSGLRQETRFSDAAAKVRGAKSKGFKFIVPSADDFKGFIYSFLGKGKTGEAHKEFFEKKLFRPLAKGIDALNRAKQALRNDYTALKKKYPKIHKMMRKDSGYNYFTNDQAVRVYLWAKNGVKIPGLSKADVKALVKIVESNPDMVAFANNISAITKLKQGYIKPGDSWLAGTIGYDLLNLNQSTRRGEYLKEFIKNTDEIFSKENLNKIEAIYGSKFREAVEDMLHRIKTGTNRSKGANRIVNRWLNWVNNSVGVIMFINTRSAVLQTISMANFVNWGDNNILQASKAFANQPQFWKDFAHLFNSDFLKQRRGGLRQDVNWQEIAREAQQSTDPIRKATAMLLQAGFTPTQIADSFAIAMGGATFYRNRIQTYLNQGLSPGDAEQKAFIDFMDIAESTQQSGRPDLVSQQQASSLGKVILAFQNVTMQYTRIAGKNISDLINNRRVRKPGGGYYDLTKSGMIRISRVAYYMGVQNLLFHSMQQALFAMVFDDETEEEELTRAANIANGMSDSILRGLGFGGAIVSTLKNMVIKFSRQSSKKDVYKQDYMQVLIEAINLSPPLGSKARKIYNALNTYKYNQEEIKRRGLKEQTLWEAMANVISAGTNIPLDKIFMKVDSLGEALDNENEAWQRIALFFGWRKWQLGVDEDPPPVTTWNNKTSTRKSTTRRSTTRRRSNN